MAVRRVLMGDFAGLARLGYREVLSGPEIELVEAATPDVLDSVVSEVPDVVVLDDDDEATEDLVELIVHRFPALKVITCSSQRPLMRVFPPLHYGESYTTGLDGALLTSAIQS